MNIDGDTKDTQALENRQSPLQVQQNKMSIRGGKVNPDSKFTIRGGSRTQSFAF